MEDTNQSKFPFCSLPLESMQDGPMKNYCWLCRESESMAKTSKPLLRSLVISLRATSEVSLLITRGDIT